MRKLLLFVFAALLVAPAAQAQTTDFSTFAAAEDIREGVLDTLRLDYLERLPSGEFVFVNGALNDDDDGIPASVVAYDPDASAGNRTRIIRSNSELQDAIGSGLVVDDLDVGDDGNIYVLARDSGNNNTIYKTAADGSSDSVLGVVGGADTLEPVGDTIYLGIIGAFSDKENSIYSISTTGTDQSGTEVLSNPDFNPDNQLEADSDGNLYFLSNPAFSSGDFTGGALVRVNDPGSDSPSAETVYQVFADGPFSDTGGGIADLAVENFNGADRIYLYNSSFDGDNGEEFGFFQADGSSDGFIYATEAENVADDDDTEAGAITGTNNPLYVDPDTGEQYFANREAFDGLNSILQISGAPLPVEFAAAPTVSVEGRAVTLAWTTLSETNNAGFFAQHKRPGASDWQTAGDRVDGAGTTTADNDYTATVRGLAPGRYLFRIKQVDTDAGQSFSKTVQATVGLEGFTLEAPSQNPFRGQTSLTYNAPENAEVEAVLFNSLGQQVRRLEAAGGRITLDAGSLSSGLYFVRLTGEDGRTDTQSVTLVR